LLNRLTCEAEAWATLGGRKLQEISPRRESLGYGLRQDRAHGSKRVPAPHVSLSATNGTSCEMPNDEADAVDW
jgi:hypothetical protein